MRFTVVWKPQAERTLLELWLESSERDAVTRAAEEIESLARKPPAKAASVDDDGYSWNPWEWIIPFRSMTEL